MKKLTIGFALAVAAIATAGVMAHPNNPLPVAGTTITADFPFPPCPTGCALPINQK